MTKLMFLTWGDTAPLTGEKLREGLAAAGATRVQVNVHDEPVAAAMRLGVYDDPVTGLVSVWTEGDAQPVADAVTAAVGTTVGWEVEERQPIPPLRMPDGERLDALANFALLRIPAELSREEWLRIWLEDHTPVGISTQGSFGYVQNIVGEKVADTTSGDVRHPDSLVEEHFLMGAISDVHAFYGSGGRQEELDRRMSVMFTSIARFGADRDIDLVPTSRYAWDLSS